MSFQTLSERLTALQDSNVQLKDLINRLATINFQPGSVPLVDDEEGNVMQELTSEIAQTIRDQEEDFELLQEEVLDLERGRQGSEKEQQRAGLDLAVKRAVKELKTFEIAFRKAQLSARKRLVVAQKAERELLLQSYVEPQSSNASPVPGQRRRNQEHKALTKEEKTANASSDVTLALRRTHDMMASELSRSQFAHDTLKESTAALAELSETYSTLDTMLSRSKNLLGSLLRSQKSDTWYLETAFYILCATIAWLIWRRILYGPAWWLMWFPMKMFIKGWMGVFAAMGSGGSPSGGVMVSSSLVASASSVVSQVTHNKATRGPRPTELPPTAAAMHFNVGGGGKGGPMRGPNIPGLPQDSGNTVSEQVGRIIDESQNDDLAAKGGSAHGEDEAEVQGNPKKRMWEEEKEAVNEEHMKRDEL